MEVEITINRTNTIPTAPCNDRWGQIESRQRGFETMGG
jgi:hypothetical protein